MLSLLRWLLLTIVGVVGVSFATVLVMAMLGVTIDLGQLRGSVESSASRVLERKVSINGPVVLEFSGWPSIEVRDITVANVADGRADYLFTAGLARLDIGLRSLLKGKLQIGEISAEAVNLYLEHDAQGQANWEVRPQHKADPVEPPDRHEPRFSFVGLDELSLQQVAVNYHDAALNKTVLFELDTLYGEASPGQPMTLAFAGHVQQDRYDLALQGEAIEQLLDPTASWTFSLEGMLFGKQIAAQGELGRRSEVPVVAVELAVQDLDVGAILSRLDLVEGMQAATRQASVDLTLRGDTLQELVRQSRLSFDITDGRWVIEYPNTQAGFSIDRLAGNILVEGGTAVTMKLSGEIEQTPVRLTIVGATLEEYLTTREELPLSIDIAMLDSSFTFDTRLAFPITRHDLHFSLAFAGKRLDAFNELLDLELPPLGPYSLDTQLTVSGEGYDLSKLAVRVGQSKLDGRLQLLTALDKPTLEVELLSPLIRADDFYFGKRKQAVADPAGSVEPAVAAEEASGDDDYRDIISFEVLNKFNATVQVEAQQVTSGSDELGSGSLTVTLMDGRLAVEPLKINTPGGGINLGYSLQPRANDMVMTVDTDIDHFDYGVMARLVDANTEMDGVMSLDVEFASTAPDLESILAHASGHLDFALFPGNFSAGVFDLWAINLITSVASEVDKGETSAVNCIVLRLALDAGRLEERVIFMDTTRMSVAGKLAVDFKTQQIALVAAPRAKRPEFFSMATPVKVQGSFEDFALGVNPLRLTGSVFSFITSPLHVPIRRVFREKVPADGREACELAWDRTADELIELQSETLQPYTADDTIRDY